MCIPWCQPHYLELKKQHVVAQSSTEAEYWSLARWTAEVVWLSSLLHELGFPHSKCPILCCDNQGTNLLVQNLVFHAQTKHIEIDMHFVMEKVASHQVEV
ncbi:hypothetical protein ACOSQ2_022570 [Xanthoceras sorbifolium]